jgi:hypothetical protein
MTLRTAYGPMYPEFDAFLFASVGEEVDGVPLSVLSALSRLDLDPRAEAARLAKLTKEAAADQLARMIALLSDRHWSVSEARRIACDLIERLPVARTAGKDDRAAPGARPTTGFAVSSSWIYLALALAFALLVGFFASG